MTTAPTLEEFLTQREADEHEPDDSYDVEPFEPGAATALESIAVSLQQLVGMAQGDVEEERRSQQLQEAHDDIHEKHAVLYELLEEVEAIIKPSTSKLANSVREAIDRWRGVPAAESDAGEPAEPDAVVVYTCPHCQTGWGEVVDPCRECGKASAPDPAKQPANDAPIEEWVAYAQSLGHDVDPGRTNRSQIRTLLGLPHS